MTVQFIRLASQGLPAGAIRILPPATEAALVADGEAIYTTVPNPAGDDLPVRFDPTTGMIVMSDGGPIASQVALQGVVSAAGNSPAKLAALVETVANDLPPELQPVDWWPDRFFAADSQYLYGHSAANALDFVRVDRTTRTRVVTVNPFGVSAPRVMRTVWASRATPGLLLVAIGESTGSAAVASMTIHRSTDYGATWATVLTLGTGDGGTINGVWLLSDRNICEMGGTIYLGEYNVNDTRTDGGTNDLLTLWRSTNGGASWSPALRWNKGGTHVARHIHALKATPDGRVLICIGDSDAESAMILWNGVTDIGNVPYASLTVPVRYGSQRYRVVDCDFRDGHIWWMSDGSTENGAAVSDVGWFRMPLDFSAPARRLDGKISAVPKASATYTATFSTGAACYIEETAGTVSAGRFQLGIWTCNEARSRIERNGAQLISTAATGQIVPVMFQADDIAYVSFSTAALGKSTTGTVAFTAASRRWCGVRPDVIHPVYWVDPVSGTDDAASERGWRPSSPFKTLKYALESNRVVQGGRVLLPAGDYDETLTVAIALNADLTNAEAAGFVTIEGAGIDATKHSLGSASTVAQTYALGLDANAGWEFKDIHVSTKRSVNTQAIISGSGVTTAQRLQAIRARIGGKDIGSANQNTAINSNIGAGGSITTTLYDSQIVGETVNAGYLITGDVDGPHHVTAYRTVFDGGRGAMNPASTDTIYTEDCLFTNFSTAAIRAAATATKVPTMVRPRFNAFVGTPQWIDDGTLTEAGQWTGARSTIALNPSAIFDATSRVDATAAPRDPRAFDYLPST